MHTNVYHPTHTTPTPPTTHEKNIAGGVVDRGRVPSEEIHARTHVPIRTPASFSAIYIKSLTPALYPKRAPDHRKWWSDFIYIDAKGRIMIYVNIEISTVREDEA